MLGPAATIAEAFQALGEHQPELALVNLTLQNGDDGAVPVRCASGAGRGGVGSFGVVRGLPYVDSHVISAGFARLFRRFRRGGQAAVPEDRTSSSLDSATSSAVFSASAS